MTVIYALFLTLGTIPQTPVLRSASPNGTSAAKLVSWCEPVNKATRDVVDTASLGRCFGYMNGYIQAFTDFTEDMACIPDAVTVSQGAKVYLKYMNEHPEYLHMDAGSTLALSVMQAFPCHADK